MAGGKGKGLNLDKELLRRLYWDEGMSQLEIAAELFVSQECIWAHMKRYGIKTRPPGCHVYYDVGGGKKMTAKEIAEAVGITPSTVRNRYARGWRGKDLLLPHNTRGVAICRSR